MEATAATAAVFELFSGPPITFALCADLLLMHQLNGMTLQHRIDTGRTTGVLGDTQRGYNLCLYGSHITAIGIVAIVCCAFIRLRTLESGVMGNQQPCSKKSWLVVIFVFGLLGYIYTGAVFNSDEKPEYYTDDYYTNTFRQVCMTPLSKVHSLGLLRSEVSAVSMYTAPPPTHSGGPSNRRVALTICGELFRFHYNSTVKQLVAHAVKAGYAVDVFIELAHETHEDMLHRQAQTRRYFDESEADAWRNEAKYSKSAQREFSVAEIKAIEGEVRSKTKLAGGNLVSFRTYKQRSLSAAEPEKFSHFTSGSPQGSEHILQQLYGMLRVWRVVEQYELDQRQFYDVVIRQRSDAYWLAPLVIKSLPHDAVSVKKCAHYGGVNDKIAVIPRQFAKHWMELLLDYYISEHRLHQGYPNPESFIGLNAMAKSIKVAPQAAELLPTVDYRPYMQPDGDKATEEGCFSPIYLGSPSVAYSIAEDASDCCDCTPSVHRSYVRDNACPVTSFEFNLMRINDETWAIWNTNGPVTTSL